MDKYIPVIVAVLALLGNLAQLVKSNRLKTALGFFIKAIEWARPAPLSQDMKQVEDEVSLYERQREAIKNSIEANAKARGIEEKLIAPLVEKLTKEL